MNNFLLKGPFTEESVRQLSAGDIVYISGKFFTCRTLFHKRALQENYLPPVDFNEVNMMMHAGPVMKRTETGWLLVALAPTTSVRFEKFTPGIIRKLGLRAIVGKATMGNATMEVMRETGCVHLSTVGVPVGLLTTKVKEIVEVHGVEEMGITEATWVFDVENFGPFLVDIDTRGNNFFHQVHAGVKGNLKKAYERLCIPLDYTYTEIQI